MYSGVYPGSSPFASFLIDKIWGEATIYSVYGRGECIYLLTNENTSRCQVTHLRQCCHGEELQSHPSSLLDAGHSL